VLHWWFSEAHPYLVAKNYQGCWSVEKSGMALNRNNHGRHWGEGTVYPTPQLTGWFEECHQSVCGAEPQLKLDLVHFKHQNLSTYLWNWSASWARHCTWEWCKSGAALSVSAKEDSAPVPMMRLGQSRPVLVNLCCVGVAVYRQLMYHSNWVFVAEWTNAVSQNNLFLLLVTCLKTVTHSLSRTC